MIQNFITWEYHRRMNREDIEVSSTGVVDEASAVVSNSLMSMASSRGILLVRIREQAHPYFPVWTLEPDMRGS